MTVDFRVLGPIEVVGEAGAVKLGGPRQRAVLAILLLHANRVVPVEQIADDLYGDAVPATAVAQVRDHVSQLRKLIGPKSGLDASESIIETHPPGYLIRVGADQFDAFRFEGLTDEAFGALGRGDAQAAADLLRQALALWRGPPLADFTLRGVRPACDRAPGGAAAASARTSDRGRSPARPGRAAGR